MITDAYVHPNARCHCRQRRSCGGLHPTPAVAGRHEILVRVLPNDRRRLRASLTRGGQLGVHRDIEGDAHGWSITHLRSGITFKLGLGTRNLALRVADSVASRVDWEWISAHHLYCNAWNVSPATAAAIAALLAHSIAFHTHATDDTRMPEIRYSAASQTWTVAKAAAQSSL